MGVRYRSRKSNQVMQGQGIIFTCPLQKHKGNGHGLEEDAHQKGVPFPEGCYGQKNRSFHSEGSVGELDVRLSARTTKHHRDDGLRRVQNSFCSSSKMLNPTLTLRDLT